VSTMTSSERLVVLVTPAEKKAFAAKAKLYHMNLSELVRESVKKFAPGDDEVEIEALLVRLNQSTQDAQAALDDALMFVAASNERIVAATLKGGH